MIYVTRKEHFNAAHRLFNPAWSDEKNQEVFGPCANNNWHGHNFIKEKIVDKVDHKNLNLDVDFMKDKMASCEIFVMEIWNILAPAISNEASNARLHYIKLVETPKNFVEYYGK
jgi:6-pyruvoyltetrahydropterin/6-carboxytetrahydropterin synthase